MRLRLSLAFSVCVWSCSRPHGHVLPAAAAVVQAAGGDADGSGTGAGMVDFTGAESMLARGKFPLDVEFVIPDKCLFGGFFVEVVLGYMLPLDGLLTMSLHMGTCDKQFLELLPRTEVT